MRMLALGRRKVQVGRGLCWMSYKITHQLALGTYLLHLDGYLTAQYGELKREK
jgi:hypothetical protein